MHGDDSTVRCLAGIHVQKLHTFHLLYFGGHLVNDIHVAALADIGHALDKLFHFYIYLRYYFYLFYYMSIHWR